MPAKHSRHIAMIRPLEEWAERQVAEGLYTSFSDLVRTAVRLLKAQEDARLVGRVAPTVPMARAARHG